MARTKNVKTMPTNESPIKKLKPAIFPMGFSLSLVGTDIIVVDFIDIIGGEMTVVESIAMPKQKADQLARAINEIDSERSGDGSHKTE